MKKLLLTFVAALMVGCASTPQAQIKQLAADARDIGEIGTRFALLEDPNYRDELELTLAGLKDLESLPDPLTVDGLVGVLSRLPLKQLKTDKAQLAVLGGRIIIRRLTGDVQLGSIGIRPIVTALREGMEAGLQ